MVNLKTLVLGAGLGLAGLVPRVADGQDVAQYENLTRAQVHRKLLERAISVNYDTFQSQVLDYDGGALVLFNSSCPQTKTDELINQHLEIIYIMLIEQFKDQRVNNLPLKFTAYDVCGKSKAEGLPLWKDGEFLRIYLNGQLIDRTGEKGPTNLEEVKPYYRNYANFWIPLNLTEPNLEYTGLYNGTSKLEKVPK